MFDCHPNVLALMMAFRHLQDWIKEDQDTYGRSEPDGLAVLATDSTSLQAAVFDAQFKGVDGLEKDILLLS